MADAIFDPCDVDALFRLDDAIEAGEVTHWITPEWRYDVRRSTEPYFDGSNDTLAAYLVGCRNALKLPLSVPVLAMAAYQLEYAYTEAQRRAQRARQAAKYPKGEDWATYDLLGAVRAATGAEGRRAGRNWWFKCPFHDDRTPSLEVEPEKRVWHCWGCGKGGGVVNWLRENRRS
jgi:hypothetical protein